MFDVLIIGGGAAGFFAAIHIAEAAPSYKVGILERGKEVLTKVKISGGGRCNVTHAEFNPADLVTYYPRGKKELLGPFHSFCSGDTVGFFEERGVSLKIEEDGRMFPTSNSSQTIIDCLVSETERLGVKLLKNSSVIQLEASTSGWEITTHKKTYSTKKVLVATGSNPKIWKILGDLGHTIEAPVPSLFTFNIQDQRIKNIPGVSCNARVQVRPKGLGVQASAPLKSQIDKSPVLETEGPLLITHWGMSGPAILKLSAWGANVLHSYNYQFKIHVNWLPDYHANGVLALLMEVKEVEAKKTILRTNAVDIPKRLWTNLVRACGISDKTKWADASKVQLENLANQLTDAVFYVDGKSTFKDEFVTAGGVSLKEINFKTYESKVCPNMYFAGEVMNIDGITGGFNFQNAWTGAYIAAKGITSS